MHNFDRLYNILMNEGKASPADKKGSKAAGGVPYNKHRNKWEGRQASKASRRQGKKETMEEGYYEDAEERDRSQDYMDLHYNLKDYLDALAREVEKYYHHYNSIDTVESSGAALLCNAIIDRLDEINEEAQGEGTREEFVALKDNVEAFMRELSSEYESFGPYQQGVVDTVIDALNDELESY